MRGARTLKRLAAKELGPVPRRAGAVSIDDTEHRGEGAVVRFAAAFVPALRTGCPSLREAPGRAANMARTGPGVIAVRADRSAVGFRRVGALRASTSAQGRAPR